MPVIDANMAFREAATIKCSPMGCPMRTASPQAGKANILVRPPRADFLKTAFGTDTLCNGKLAEKQSKLLAKLVRWYTPAEILKMATAADNAELLALSGPRNS